MPPRRSQPTRQTKSTAIDQVLVDKRAQRHLDELEKSNYTELDDEQTAAEGGVRRGHRGTARHTLISDQRAGYKKKKSTMNVRSALMYKKNLATLIEESGISAAPTNYLNAAVPPSKYPSRPLCSVCGYWSSYKCKKCALPYCDLNCEAVHDETRCERRVL